MLENIVFAFIAALCISMISIVLFGILMLNIWAMTTQDTLQLWQILCILFVDIFVCMFVWIFVETWD